LQLSNKCGLFTDEIELKYGLCKVLLPSAFTPNGDGLNDQLKVLGTELVSTLQFTLCNRWGQVVYQTADKTKGWDGTFNGQQQPIGSYSWILSYKIIGEEKTHKTKGTVLLIR
jgi:gliding motility-associated-like protein